MADYCTTAEVKVYKDIAQSDDDVLLAALITRASARIDRFCARTFTARAETRYFDALRDVDRQKLYLDDDLISVTSITNGDGTTVTSGQYVLEPVNHTPKYQIRLKASSGISWTYQTDPESAITVSGLWGYASGTVPPDDIKHAAVRLSAWYYDQRPAPFERQAFLDTGVIVTPADMPPDVRILLDPYKRRRV